MQRTRQNGFIYSRDGSPFLWIGYRRGGRLIRESTGTADRSKAQDILRSRQKMVVDETIDTLATTVDDLYQLVTHDYSVNGKATLDDVEARWKHHLEPFFGGLKARQVSSELVNDYVQKRLLAEAKPATINRELAILRRMYNLGRRAKRVLHDHVPYVQMLKENNARRGFLEPSQYDRLVTELSKEGLWMRCLFECAYTWGFRKGELTISEGKGGLKVGQVDFAERVVRLEAGETKNDEGREVPMTNLVFELLKIMCEGKKPGDYVFTRPMGKRTVPVQSFRKTWKSACTRAGVPNLLFHDLRRSAIRTLVRSGVNQQTAMKISGHKTASVFARYNIVSKADKVDALKKRETYLNSVNEKSDAPICSQSAHNAHLKSTKAAAKLLN